MEGEGKVGMSRSGLGWVGCGCGVEVVEGMVDYEEEEVRVEELGIA